MGYTETDKLAINTIRVLAVSLCSLMNPSRNTRDFYPTIVTGHHPQQFSSTPPQTQAHNHQPSTRQLP